MHNVHVHVLGGDRAFKTWALEEVGHAQDAGAVAVIFVRGDSDELFVVDAGEGG